MSKNTLKTKPFVALKLLTAVLSIIMIPTANAGILDNIFGINEISVSNQNQLYANSYLVQNSYTSNNVTAGSDQASNFVSGDNFIVAFNSPAKITHSIINKEIISKEVLVSITAYSSTPDQTDSSPFTTAMGTEVRDGVIATNFLPFGTKIKIPQVFGDKIFTVEDRMNKRYSERIDIWFPDRESANNFGLKTLKVQILES